MLSVVEDTQIVEFEIVHWDAVEVGGVKGDAHLIDGDVEGVGIGGSRWRFRYLRQGDGENADRGEHHDEVGWAFAPMTGHG